MNIKYFPPIQRIHYGVCGLQRQHPTHLARIALLISAVCFTLIALAEDATYPELNDSDELSLMRTLSDHGLHDMKDERWNIYAQGTYISQWQPAFAAAYSNLNGTPNSLKNSAANSFTGTVTPTIGVKTWQGAAFYYAPEMIAESPLSNLKGLGGSIQDFELQKTGSESATWYTSRAYFKQTFSLGGMTSDLASAPMQLAGTVTSRRIVISAGRLSVLDIFDKNTYAGDLRHQFFNMAFMANGAYDFAADARGFSQGLAAEWYYDNWAVRAGRFAIPVTPNVLNMDYHIFEHYGDQIEVEHKHRIDKLPGAVKFLVYRNRADTGKFSDATKIFNADPAKNGTTCTTANYSNPNANAPDLCWARTTNTKLGIGINMEQSISDDIGIFMRGMWTDGLTEVYNYSSADDSLSLGAIMKGSRWGREQDSIGLGYAASFLSTSHVAYLNMGGIDGFLGDGAISYKPEQVVDLYYQHHLMKSTWLSVDYQHLTNPGYNSVRGPVDIYGVRVHVEL